jgi:hypothetical protein
MVPIGQSGDTTISSAMQVTIQAPKITLGEALAQLTQQLKVPALEWSISPEFEGVLFSAGALDTFPMQAGHTGLLTRQAIRRNTLLGTAVSTGEVPLEDLAFNNSQLGQVHGEWPTVGVGQRGQEVYTQQPPTVMLWRLAQVKQAYEPQSVEAVAGLRERVIHDVKLQRAFDLARQKAQAMVEAASAQGLEAVAKQADKTVQKTDLFSRLMMSTPQQDYAQLVQNLGQRTPTRLYFEMILAKPVDFEASQPRGLDLSSPALRQRAIDAAFALAPADPEPPYPPAPSVGMAPLPATAGVLVMQRIDYTPAVESEYLKSRTMLLARLAQRRMWDSRHEYFSADSVIQRTGYVGEGKPRATAATSGPGQAPQSP